MAECECGCGEIVAPDKRGRPRRFASRAHALNAIRVEFPEDERADRGRERVARWHAAHPRRVLQVKAAWRERNREVERAKARERARARYWADPEAARERSRVANRDRRAYKAYHESQRRAVKRVAEGSFTWQEWQAVMATADHRCLACHGKLPLTVDHVVPLSRGGRNDIGNIQPLCKSCNSRKGVQQTDYRETADAL